ncbi:MULTISPECIES: hypothetical protein [Bradyrhizobium]|uniref:Uncharacterized protein n=1 Tax=Bradyrhizobium diazoefficiens TaxID=1355477 RepID=A0A810C5S7_9BRAD|nr:hypothetical protein [Bradyrhizobium diazoefficiens]MBP1065920.1 hypothetical protein [Bradyrhizobium japonicum]AWO91032.1 hypothetical protein DI395_22705 [Bradyrhizobium diazoefficiens]WLB42326.1 hypothetical protein QIH78_21790 [Bradyrhizobium diazoefficiens]WLC20774.1 hypothetical protein QIH76_21510 [Bradyrhizobium diazoefficiens]BCA03710.1 hypothetical protein H12S4_46140 [Bradyrhizobium diazoefficiens]
MKRIVKIVLAAVCGIATAAIGTGGLYLFSGYRAYRNAEITTTLIREGKYDPAEHFSFDRACVFPPESALADTWFSQRGYRQLDPILPDTYTNWTLILVDDQRKTFRTLYALEVRFGGNVVCNPRLVLRTRSSQEGLVAYIDDASAH